VQLFHRIDDAEAIVRLKGGVFKQTELYRRGDRIYVKHGSGFVRLCGGKLGDHWGTSAPGVNVIDMTEHPHIRLDREPRWTGGDNA
jgi:hypothetical protein